MANVYDCWIVKHRDGRATTASPDRNIHEVLFVATHAFNPVPGSPGTMTKLVAAFRSEWIGNRHRKQAA